MNCLECQDLLQKRLDGERIAAAALDRHLTECAACREQHAGALRLLDGLKRVPKPALASGFAQAMAAQVVRDRRHRQEKMRRRVVLTMALAASVLLMLFAAYYWLPPPAGKDEPKVVDNHKPVKVPPKDPVVPKENPKPEPRHALSALTDRLADTTRDHAQVVLVAANLGGMDRLPAVQELPADPNVQEVSDGVRTVTRNARKAFDYFARELPMPEVGEHKN